MRIWAEFDIFHRSWFCENCFIDFWKLCSVRHRDVKDERIVFSCFSCFGFNEFQLSYKREWFQRRVGGTFSHQSFCLLKSDESGYSADALGKYIYFHKRLIGPQSPRVSCFPESSILRGNTPKLEKQPFS